MILILSDSPREASLLGDLFEHRSWPCATGGSIADFKKLLGTTTPRVVVVRQRLADGCSDDILGELDQRKASDRPRLIVLMAGTTSIHQEARQVNLGADCVLRDPLRIEVLLEYVSKYRSRASSSGKTTRPVSRAFKFAGVQVSPSELLLTRAKRRARTTPRVIDLLGLLHRLTGQVAPYPLIYSEIFGRRFTGDTSNCRVLVGKAVTDFQRLGVNLRTCIEVIPKSGYRYRVDK